MENITHRNKLGSGKNNYSKVHNQIKYSIITTTVSIYTFRTTRFMLKGKQ